MADSIQLVNNATGAPYGTITEEQLATLVDALEEETDDDVAYYISTATLEVLREADADAALLGLLEQALAPTGEAEIRWVRS